MVGRCVMWVVSLSLSLVDNQQVHGPSPTRTAPTDWSIQQLQGGEIEERKEFERNTPFQQQLWVLLHASIVRRAFCKRGHEGETSCYVTVL